MSHCPAARTRTGMAKVAESTGDSPKPWWGRDLPVYEIGLLVALLNLVIVFSPTDPNFLTDRNLVNILRAASYVGIIAFPMTFVIIAGEIDISVGPAVAFFGVAFAQAVSAYAVPIPIAMVLVILAGAAAGGCAGWLKVRYAVPTFISALALWGSLRGGARWWTDALPVIIPSREFRTVLGGDLFGIPVVAWFMFATFVIFACLARFGRYGRHIHAVGANAQAVEALGINTGRLRILALASTGAFAALVGVLTDARLGSGNASAASGLEFDVIAAVSVGGTLLTGGHGLTGTLLGVLVIACLSNGLVLVGVDSDVQAVVQGAVILLAVLVNAEVARRSFSGRTA